VALGAQRTKLAQAKQLVAASMRCDVVDDRRRRHAADFQAEPTQRLNAQLMPPPALPARGTIPAMNFTAAVSTEASN